jgi:S1-C subfamily serine protease
VTRCPPGGARAGSGRRAWLWACALLLASPADALALELPQLAEKCTPSVVLLTVSDATGRPVSTGSGFFVSSDGLLVTNHHVIREASAVTATLHDGRAVPVEGLVVSSQAVDLAVLKVGGGPYPPLALGDANRLRIGDEVVVIGSPRGLSTSVSAGIVSAIRKDGLPVEPAESGEYPTGSWGIQISAPISPGSSGSPILTRDGEVVAVAVGSFQLAENLNFGIPIQLLQALLDRAKGMPPQPFAATESHSVLRNLGISAAFFAALAAAFFIGGRLSRRRAGKRERTSADHS